MNKKNRFQDRQNQKDILDAYRHMPMNFDPDKVDNLERTIKFLVEQMNSFEKMLYNETRRNKSYFETEKEHIDRVETNLKVYEDNLTLANNDFINKLSLLEARLLREEKAKIELKEKVLKTFLCKLIFSNSSCLGKFY